MTRSKPPTGIWQGVTKGAFNIVTVQCHTCKGPFSFNYAIIVTLLLFRPENLQILFFIILILHPNTQDNGVNFIYNPFAIQIWLPLSLSSLKVGKMKCKSLLLRFLIFR